MDSILTFFKDPKVIENLAGVFTQMIAFLIFLWVLKRFAWKPVMKVLDDRRNKIKGDFERVETLEKKFTELTAKHEEKLEHIDVEARKKIQEAIDEGKEVSREITDNARTEAKDIIDKGMRHINIELENARKQLKDDVGSMVIKITEKLLRTSIDDRKHRELVSSFINELEGNK